MDEYLESHGKTARGSKTGSIEFQNWVAGNEVFRLGKTEPRNGNKNVTIANSRKEAHNLRMTSKI